MGFFKDFKEDFSQAVTELIPGEDSLETKTKNDDLVVNTLEGEVDVESELSKLDGLLEQVKSVKPVQPDVLPVQTQIPPASPRQAVPPVSTANQPVRAPEPAFRQTTSAPQSSAPGPSAARAASAPNPSAVNHTSSAPFPARESTARTTQEEKTMADNAATSGINQERVVTDEVSVITEGTVIKGDIMSNGSLDIRGQVNGNVGCNGKLTVTGVVNGNSDTSEFFADAAQVEGEVVSSGTVKIGLGSVIIGNVTSASAVIAGAIKGDIDVQGPVVVDTSAVVMGNIKSRSVQINNGAVIEGFCSQCYSDVDVQSLFDNKKGTGAEASAE